MRGAGVADSSETLPLPSPNEQDSKVPREKVRERRLGILGLQAAPQLKSLSELLGWGVRESQELRHRGMRSLQLSSAIHLLEDEVRFLRWGNPDCQLCQSQVCKGSHKGTAFGYPSLAGLRLSETAHLCPCKPLATPGPCKTPNRVRGGARQGLARGCPARRLGLVAGLRGGVMIISFSLRRLGPPAIAGTL